MCARSLFCFFFFIILSTYFLSVSIKFFYYIDWHFQSNLSQHDRNNHFFFQFASVSMTEISNRRNVHAIMKTVKFIAKNLINIFTNLINSHKTIIIVPIPDKTVKK